MQRARIEIPAGILVSLFVLIGCATMTRGGGLPTCFSAQTCGPSADRDSLEFGPAARTGALWEGCNDPAGLPSFFGPTVVSDFSDGVSSDGRGPYAPGADGVLSGSSVSWAAGIGLESPRKLVLNLSHPVPGGGGVPLGTITVGEHKLPQWFGLHTQWRTVDNTTQNLADIAVGQMVPAAQMNVFFFIGDKFHLLQMGPQPFGHCHAGRNLVTGAATTAATIYRATATKWVVDLPPGSVGRLFDLHNTTAHAVDGGLYYLRLHYEIATKPGAINVLQPLAQTQGGAAVVASYRALKRDSTDVYFFDEGALYGPGSWLLNNKQPQDALHVFSLGVEEYPTSGGYHSGLAKSYLAVGDTSRAIASFRRSVELNPGNAGNVEILKRLGAKP